MARSARCASSSVLRSDPVGGSRQCKVAAIEGTCARDELARRPCHFKELPKADHVVCPARFARKAQTDIRTGRNGSRWCSEQMKDQSLFQLGPLRLFIAFCHIERIERRELECGQGNFRCVMDRATRSIDIVRLAADLLWARQERCRPGIQERFSLRSYLLVIDGPGRRRCSGRHRKQHKEPVSEPNATPRRADHFQLWRRRLRPMRSHRGWRRTGADCPARADRRFRRPRYPQPRPPIRQEPVTGYQALGTRLVPGLGNPRVVSPNGMVVASHCGCGGRRRCPAFHLRCSSNPSTTLLAASDSNACAHCRLSCAASSARAAVRSVSALPRVPPSFATACRSKFVASASCASINCCAAGIELWVVGIIEFGNLCAGCYDGHRHGH